MIRFRATPPVHVVALGPFVLEMFRRAAYVVDLNICISGKDRRMAITNPLQFIQQVRSETSKIVWPTRREVLLTTIMVLIMATLTAIFFALVDLLIRTGVHGLLGLFG